MTRKTEAELAALPTVTAVADTPAAQVDKAMASFDQMERLINDPAARAKLPKLFAALELQMGLRFQPAIKGKKRIVQRLVGGTIVLGDHALPPINETGGDFHHRLLGSAEPQSLTGPLLASPLLATRPVKCRLEGISSTLVNRGDRTAIELFLAGIRRWESDLQRRLDDTKPKDT